MVRGGLPFRITLAAASTVVDGPHRHTLTECGAGISPVGLGFQPWANVSVYFVVFAAAGAEVAHTHT